MTDQPASRGERIATLDFIRGIAVMGIFPANLPFFGLPGSALFSPLSWGGTGPADVAVWFAQLVFIEGKMRGLFSFLFGASMLLVADRAAAAGQSAASIHYRRMATLFAIGCAHLYLFWAGDILAHYALVGAVAFLFRHLSVRALIWTGIAFLVLQTLFSLLGGLALLDSVARDTPARIATWNGFAEGFGVPSAQHLAAEIAAIGGSFGDAATWRLVHANSPLTFLPLVGGETLSAMLFGMAALRSGFLTGAWDKARYRRIAWGCLLVALPVYAAMGVATAASGFDQRWVYFSSIVIAEPFRIVTVVGYASILVLVAAPAGAVVDRIAAVGRAAFTNYLGSTLIATFVFSGWGLAQFGQWSRAELYWLVPVVWGTMLLWSKPWLRRFRFGPLEWLWRTLSRGRLQPMRRSIANHPQN